ncbi:unnamed protein product [Schistocephalus solidus]|uniref:non-specific serine/threonine protein kinase n=1 Tax=Schistocephalus solidus TaxID=70667 RepID=A0A183T8E2_SCHSO|nr:unnamed protein product [Schistocephalus solidus]
MLGLKHTPTPPYPLAIMQEMGFTCREIQDALENNKFNNVTATYLLLGDTSQPLRVPSRSGLSSTTSAPDNASLTATVSPVQREESEGAPGDEEPAHINFRPSYIGVLSWPLIANGRARKIELVYFEGLFSDGGCSFWTPQVLISSPHKSSRSNSNNLPGKKRSTGVISLIRHGTNSSDNATTPTVSTPIAHPSSPLKSPKDVTAGGVVSSTGSSVGTTTTTTNSVSQRPVSGRPSFEDSRSFSCLLPNTGCCSGPSKLRLATPPQTSFCRSPLPVSPTPALAEPPPSTTVGVRRTHTFTSSSSAAADRRATGATGHRLGQENLEESTKALVRAPNVSNIVRSNRPERRTALVARELARDKMDIAALSETRFSEQGSAGGGGCRLHLILERPAKGRHDATLVLLLPSGTTSWAMEVVLYFVALSKDRLITRSRMTETTTCNGNTDPSGLDRFCGLCPGISAPPLPFQATDHRVMSLLGHVSVADCLLGPAAALPFTANMPSDTMTVSSTSTSSDCLSLPFRPSTTPSLSEVPGGLSEMPETEEPDDMLMISSIRKEKLTPRQSIADSEKNKAATLQDPSFLTAEADAGSEMKKNNDDEVAATTVDVALVDSPGGSGLKRRDSSFSKRKKRPAAPAIRFEAANVHTDGKSTVPSFMRGAPDRATTPSRVHCPPDGSAATGGHRIADAAVDAVDDPCQASAANVAVRRNQVSELSAAGTVPRYRPVSTSAATARVKQQESLLRCSMRYRADAREGLDVVSQTEGEGEKSSGLGNEADVREDGVLRYDSDGEAPKDILQSATTYHSGTSFFRTLTSRISRSQKNFIPAASVPSPDPAVKSDPQVPETPPSAEKHPAQTGDPERDPWSPMLPKKHPSRDSAKNLQSSTSPVLSPRSLTRSAVASTNDGWDGRRSHSRDESVSSQAAEDARHRKQAGSLPQPAVHGSRAEKTSWGQKPRKITFPRKSRMTGNDPARLINEVIAALIASQVEFLRLGEYRLNFVYHLPPVASASGSDVAGKAAPPAPTPLAALVESRSAASAGGKRSNTRALPVELRVGVEVNQYFGTNIYAVRFKQLSGETRAYKAVVDSLVKLIKT